MLTFLKELWLSIKSLQRLRAELTQIKKQQAEILLMVKTMSNIVDKGRREQIALRELLKPSTKV